jgi:glycosyltransferase involved in cell wall biosynthesis
VSDLELLVVGPAGEVTGGVARYVTEQCRHLPSTVTTTVYDDGTTGGSLRSRAPSKAFAAVRQAAAFPAQSRPDVVHVHSSHGLSFYRAAVYVRVAADLWDRPVVLHVHGSSFDEFVRTDSGVSRRIQSSVFGAADAIVVLSEYWRRVLSERVTETKLRVLPNAVDVSEYEPSFGGAPPTVAFVSNHIRRKGIREFVEAVDRLQGEDVPTFRTLIAGDGPESAHARRLADRYETVEYVGYVSEREKRRLLEDASIYVLPTYAEGLPIALLEGMAGGNAVVSTTVGSIPEVVGDANGRLVASGDVDQLTAALRDLVSDPDAVTSMGRANARLVREEYSWSTIAAQLTELYRSVAD